MSTFSEDFVRNYDTITAKVQGGAARAQILMGAVALTIFERIETWVSKKGPVGRAQHGQQQPKSG